MLAASALVVAVAILVGSSVGQARGRPVGARIADSICQPQSGNGAVQCQLPTTGSEIAISTLVADAQGANSAVSDTSPMVIDAYGGYGSDGYGPSGGDGGDGGHAETVTTASSYQSTWGPNLFYYVGSDGSTISQAGALGGASSIVASVSLATNTPCILGCSSTNVLLDAGGGGAGGGGPGNGCDGKSGGDGATATATTSGSANIAGNGGGGNDCNSAGGSAGGGNQNGQGGGGGAGHAGGGTHSHDGHSGQNGAGGEGGPVHGNSGPVGTTGWENVTSLPDVGTLGQGGEGESRGGYYSDGGGSGGGGWGGGGGGGSNSTGQGGGGGGGGGSWAIEATTSAGQFTDFDDSTVHGAVVVTFTTEAASTLSGLSVTPNPLQDHGTGARATIKFRLSRPARVKLRLVRLDLGRRPRRHCVIGATRGEFCRLPRVWGTRTISGHSGVDRVRVDGRLGGRRLARGHYRLTATVVGGHGVSIVFTVRGE